MTRRPRRVLVRAHRIRSIAFGGVLALALALPPVAGSARAEAIAPGSAQWPPKATTPSEAVTPPDTHTEIEAEGLYSYTTPFAPPRWLRLQQAGPVVWGTIDINDSFGMCSRSRFDGTISGNVLSFAVPLEDTYCPCSGPGALLTFTGSVDTLQGTISGTWVNNCTPPPPGTWSACWVPEETLGVGAEAAGEECFLPDNAPPRKVRQTPAGGVMTWALLAAGLAAGSLAALRRPAARGVRS